MGRRDRWRDGEVRIISVTPVSRGVVRPSLLFATTIAIVVVAAGRFDLAHRYEDLAAIVLAGPIGVVALTRLWRWRSHKIHVTSERIVLEGGVLRHWQTSVELRDVVGVHVEQRFFERLARRGTVLLDTQLGALSVGTVHHPAALCRVIDAERGYGASGVPMGTIFSYDEPELYRPEVRAEQWPRLRFE